MTNNQEMRELVERLRTKPTGDAVLHAMTNEAADAIESLTRRVSELEDALTPKPAPDGLVPYGLSLEPSRQNAEYWFTAGRKEMDRGKAVLCVSQAMYAWKNAAYAMAEELAKTQAERDALRAELSGLKLEGYLHGLPSQPEGMRYFNSTLPPGAFDVVELYSKGDTAQAQVPGWISVSEKAPPEGEEVLSHNGRYSRVVVFRSKGSTMDPRTSQTISPRATHWMQLPPAPKENNHG